MHVGPGARLELSDVAGTVAYAGRGRAATWTTHLELAEDAELVYAGQPFVVGEGAEVTRRDPTPPRPAATALIRETLSWAAPQRWWLGPRAPSFRRAGRDCPDRGPGARSRRRGGGPGCSASTGDRLAARRRRRARTLAGAVATSCSSRAAASPGSSDSRGVVDEWLRSARRRRRFHWRRHRPAAVAGVARAHLGRSARVRVRFLGCLGRGRGSGRGTARSSFRAGIVLAEGSSLG